LIRDRYIDHDWRTHARQDAARSHPDGQADAFAAFPDRGERYPGVLMYADGFGVRPVLREMARELAGHGYYVLVPNLVYRHIGEDVRNAVFAQLMPLIEAHTADRVLSDADAYLRFLAAQPEVAAGPVAVTGYCIGGLLATRTAAAPPRQGCRPRRISRSRGRGRT
jgi:carboxymethylenebutenolidase